MSPSKATEIVPGIFWVGAVDWQRRIFDSLISLPYGTSYNAYLIVGKDKIALVDTVDPGFEDTLFSRIAQIAKPEEIDYLVMNHAEPDHAGAIPKVLGVAKDAKLVATEKGVEMAGFYYGVPRERAIPVKDGATLDLGGMTLRFVEAPWLHWPETMFTLCPETSVLFTCDFLGSHIASDKLFDDEVGDILIPEAKRYYAEIMMPFARLVERALDKIGSLEIKVIAPSHGPVHRNPKRIIAAYEGWVRGPLAQKAVVVYTSMWGSTEILVKAIAEAISAEGVETVPYNVVNADISHIARDLVDASAIVIGSPTVLGGPHPLVGSTVELARALRPRAKLAAIVSSYGWGGGAATRLREHLQSSGFDVLGIVETKGPPRKEDLEKATDLGRLVGQRVKGVA